MKGTIKKVEATDEGSTYNTVGDVHEVEFDNLPVIDQRFYVFEKARGGLRDRAWSTSGVQSISKIEEDVFQLRTHYSVYELTITERD